MHASTVNAKTRVFRRILMAAVPTVLAVLFWAAPAQAASVTWRNDSNVERLAIRVSVAFSKATVHITRNRGDKQKSVSGVWVQVTKVEVYDLETNSYRAIPSKNCTGFYARDGNYSITGDLTGVRCTKL